MGKNKSEFNFSSINIKQYFKDEIVGWNSRIEIQEGYKSLMGEIDATNIFCQWSIKPICL